MCCAPCETNIGKTQFLKLMHKLILCLPTLSEFRKQVYVVGSVSDSSVEHSIQLFCGNILLGISTLPNSIAGRRFRSILDRIGERNEAPSFILARRKILAPRSTLDSMQNSSFPRSINSELTVQI